MSLEKILLNFDKGKENVGRQITNVVATRNVYPEICSDTLHQKLTSGEKKLLIPKQTAFELEGIKGVIETQEDALVVAATIAKYNFSVDNALISDIGSGLYTMLTTGTGLYEAREIGTKDKAGNFEPSGARLIISMDTLHKALFGPCVDNKGRAITGAGPIVKDLKKRIMPIINGTEPMPRAYASIQKKDKTTGKTIEAVIEGEPLRIYRKISGARDALIVDLDYFFFPALQNENDFKASDQFLHSVAGLTAFLRLGSQLHSEGKKTGVNVQTARKIILAAQAAFELRNFSPGIVKENIGKRINIALRRKAIANLYPAAYNKRDQWIDFRKFSDAVSTAGQYFYKAMEQTGIKEILTERQEVIIPAVERAAEFPPELPNIVHLKADRLK